MWGLLEQVRSPVDDLRLASEPRITVHHSEELYDPPNPVKGAEFSSERGQAVEHRKASCFARLAEPDLAVDFSDDAITVPLVWTVAGDEDQVASPHSAEVVRYWWRWLRELQPHLRKTSFDDFECH